MSEHIEWGQAKYATPRLEIVPPGDVTDPYGTSNDQPALVVDEGGDAFVLEGTAAELLAFGQKIVALASDYEGDEDSDDEDEEASE